MSRHSRTVPLLFMKLLFLYISAIFAEFLPMGAALLGKDTLDERRPVLGYGLDEPATSSCTFAPPDRRWQHSSQPLVCAKVTPQDYDARIQGGTLEERAVLRAALATVRSSHPSIQSYFDFAYTYTAGLSFYISDELIQLAGHASGAGMFIPFLNVIVIHRHNFEGPDIIRTLLYEVLRHEMRHAYCSAWQQNAYGKISPHCFPQEKSKKMDKLWKKEAQRHKKRTLPQPTDNLRPIDSLYMDRPHSQSVMSMTESRFHALVRNPVAPDREGVLYGPVNVTKINDCHGGMCTVLVQRQDRDRKYFNAYYEIEPELKRANYSKRSLTFERDAWLWGMLPPDQIAAFHPAYYKAMHRYQAKPLKNPAPASRSHTPWDISRLIQRHDASDFKSLRDIMSLNVRAFLEKEIDQVKRGAMTLGLKADSLDVNLQSLLKYALGVLSQLKKSAHQAVYIQMNHELSLEGDGLGSCRQAQRHRFFKRREFFRTKDFSQCVVQLTKERRYREAKKVCDMAIEDHEAFLANMPLGDSAGYIVGAIDYFRRQLSAINEYLSPAPSFSKGL